MERLTRLIVTIVAVVFIASPVLGAGNEIICKADSLDGKAAHNTIIEKGKMVVVREQVTQKVIPETPAIKAMQSQKYPGMSKKTDALGNTLPSATCASGKIER